MIHSVDLRAFRCHAALSLEFGEGLSLVCAPNGGGKSSLVQALEYALYGRKALSPLTKDDVTCRDTVAAPRVVLIGDLGHMFKVTRHVRSGGSTLEVMNGETSEKITGTSDVEAYFNGYFGIRCFVKRSCAVRVRRPTLRSALPEIASA